MIPNETNVDRSTHMSTYPLSLEDQTVAILGGAGRMGLATARSVMALGGNAVLIGRDRTKLTDAACEVGSDQVATLIADAGDVTALREVLESIDGLGHIVVAIAANAAAAGIHDTAPDDARRAFARYWASYNAVHLAADLLPPVGSVTLVSGSSARTPAPGFGVWTALHGAIEALARAAYIDIAPVRVNVVSPGGIAMRPDRLLVPRPSEPDDIGTAIASMIANGAITGAVLDVDGGERKGTWSG